MIRDHTTVTGSATQDGEVTMDDAPKAQRAKNEGAIQFLQSLMADESGYDEPVWPELKNGLEENRTSHWQDIDA